MKQLNRGVLVAIEGIDGSGKSTVAKNLAHALASLSLPVLLTKEPGDTPLGTIIREVLHDAAIPKTPKAEFLLFASDRAQHMSTVVLPALKENKLVISDRMADSSVVYQGIARGLSLDMINTINSWCMESRKPDIVVYIRVSAHVAYQRLITRHIPLTSFEQEPTEFFETLVQGFDIHMNNKKNVLIIDGEQEPAAVADQTLQMVRTWLQNNNIW